VSIQGIHAAVAPPFDTALTIRRDWGVNILSWAGGGQLQRADGVTGPWQTLLTATNPYTVQAPVPTTYYRVTRPRPATLYVPSSYDGQTNLPLVIVLHGGGQTGALMESALRFDPEAEARGFLCCYPDGTLDRSGYRYWNGTDTDDMWNEHVDDAGYLRAVVEQISRQFAVDRKRVYLVGLSMGGEMAYGVACQSADLIAGIATHGGNTFQDPNRCQPTEPVNILCICGTADGWGNYYGGAWTGITVLQNMSPFPGAVRTVQIWAEYNGAQDPVTDPAPTLDLDVNLPPDVNLSGLDTVVTRYTSYPPGGAVELWSVIGGTHILQAYNDTSVSEFKPRLFDWLFAHPKP